MLWLAFTGGHMDSWLPCAVRGTSVHAGRGLLLWGTSAV